LIILLIIIFIISASLISFFVLPVKFSFHFSGGTDRDMNILGIIRFFGGFAGLGFKFINKEYFLSPVILSKQIFEIRITKYVRKLKSKTHKKEKPKKEPEKSDVSFYERFKKGYEKTKNIVINFRKIYKDFFRIVNFSLFNTEIVLGLGNPAYTGMAAGLVFAINEMLPERFRFNPQWDFTKKAISGKVELEGKISLFSLWKIIYEYYPMMKKGKSTKCEVSASINA